MSDNLHMHTTMVPRIFFALPLVPLLLFSLDHEQVIKGCGDLLLQFSISSWGMQGGVLMVRKQ